MGLLNQKNKAKGKAAAKQAGQNSKFIHKPAKASGFVKKINTTGAKRGS